MTYDETVTAIRQFCEERDWTAKNYHNPKNLAMAISSEAGEVSEALVALVLGHMLNHASGRLCDSYRWLTMEEARISEHWPMVSKELADVAIFTIRLSQILGIDLLSAIEDKLDENAKNYPVELSRGNAKKKPGSRAHNTATCCCVDCCAERIMVSIREKK